MSASLFKRRTSFERRLLTASSGSARHHGDLFVGVALNGGERQPVTKMRVKNGRVSKASERHTTKSSFLTTCAPPLVRKRIANAARSWCQRCEDWKMVCAYCPSLS